MKPLTILHTEASNGWGGQEIRVLNEMLGMRARGHRMLLAAPPSARIFHRASEAGIQSFPLAMDAVHFVPGVIQLMTLIRKCTVSLINTHSSRDSWIGGIAGRLSGIKVLRTRHISSRLNSSPLTRLVYGRICHGVITTGEFIKAQLMTELNVDADRIFPIATGIDVGHFRNGDGKAFRQEGGIHTDAMVIGIAAVLRSWKGHLDLLQAMKAVISAHPDSLLVIAGEGPRRRVIEPAIKDLGLEAHVKLLGHRDDIHRVISGFDIAVLASYASEGIPQFILQAMAAGKPVVGTRVGGIPEVVRDGVTGILVPPRDPEAMAQAIRDLIEHPERRAAMGQEGFLAVNRGCTLDAMLDRIEALYASLGFQGS